MTPVPLLFIAAIHWLWRKVERKKETEESNDLEKTAVKINSVTGNSKSSITAIRYKSSPNDDSPLMNVNGKQNIFQEISLS